MTARSIRGAVCLAAAGLVVAAAPALATEGPPPPPGGGGGGQPLPDTLQPVTIPQQLGPSVWPAPRTKRAKRPRVTRFSMTRRIRVHRHPHLRLGVATPGSVRVVIERRGSGKAKRVWSRTVAARRTSLAVHLPARLRAGRYRVTVVSVDAQGQRSRPVRRALVVVHS
jgi:hypothetical protein